MSGFNLSVLVGGGCEGLTSQELEFVLAYIPKGS